jgi:hypothetical protein
MTAVRKCFNSVIMVFSARGHSYLELIRTWTSLSQQYAAEAINNWREVFRNTRYILALS